MTPSDLEWILGLDPLVVAAAHKRIASTYNAGPVYPVLARELGNPALCTVMRGMLLRIQKSSSRADYHGFAHNIKFKYMMDLWFEQKGRCAVTGQIMSFETGTHNQKNAYSCSIDRIDSGKGYVEGNVRLLVHWANNAMNTWDDALFESMILSAAQLLAARKVDVPAVI